MYGDEHGWSFCAARAWPVGEVKQVAIGDVQRRTDPKGEQEVHTQQVSYFARLADVDSFSDQASSEVRRRGIERAKVVVAVQDGAEWVQGVVQAHRADAVRILDFAHAAQRVAAIGEQVRLSGQPLPTDWLETVLHQLKHEGPTAVLTHVQQLSEQLGQPEAIEEHVHYLCKRVAQMDYPIFQKQGYPIGSGIVESGNKVVMQARLKGAGMHWHPDNVNPMLALRMALCNHRWEEGCNQQQSWHEARREVKRRELQPAPKAPLSHQQSIPSPQPPPVPPKPAGRTEAQKRWGRQTFSQRAILEGRYAKK